MFLTIKLPPKEPSAPKRVIIMDVTPTFFDTIIEALKTSAPQSIISKSWSLALIVGIGPSPPPDNEDEITQYMFQIIFRWSPLSSITLSQVQEIISSSSISTHTPVRIITRSRRSDQPHSLFADTPLNCLAIFSRNLQEAIPRSVRVKSAFLSYQFTLALHDNCSDLRIVEVLSSISSTILNHTASWSEVNTTFQHTTPIHSNFSAAPRISNNWRYVATFHRQPQDDCTRLLNSLLSLHKSHRAKLLLPTSNPPSKIKNATFSFFNEMKQSKIKPNANLIEWMVSTFNTFTSNNPISLQTETEDGSASDRPDNRNPKNPWGLQLQLQPQPEQQQTPTLESQILESLARKVTLETQLQEQQQQQQQQQKLTSQLQLEQQQLQQQQHQDLQLQLQLQVQQQQYLTAASTASSNTANQTSTLQTQLLESLALKVTLETQLQEQQQQQHQQQEHQAQLQQQQQHLQQQQRQDLQLQLQLQLQQQQLLEAQSLAAASSSAALLQLQQQQPPEAQCPATASSAAALLQLQQQQQLLHQHHQHDLQLQPHPQLQQQQPREAQSLAAASAATQLQPQQQLQQHEQVQLLHQHHQHDLQLQSQPQLQQQQSLETQPLTAASSAPAQPQLQLHQQQLLEAQSLATTSSAAAQLQLQQQQPLQAQPPAATSSAPTQLQLQLQELQPFLQHQIDQQQQQLQRQQDSQQQLQGRKLSNLIPPDMLPLFENYNETLHESQNRKHAHLKMPKITFPASSTSLSPTHSTPLSISFTRTVKGIVYCTEKPMLFTRYDFGQMITVEGQRYGNACLILCLAAQTKLNPADLALYFSTRTQMLNDAIALYDKHELLRDSWANFCHPSPPPNFVHLVSNFPRTFKDDWAGSFTLGSTIAFNHISTLAPTEICNSSILFITDNSLQDNHDIEILISDAPNKMAYFPPKEIASGATPTCIIILHRNDHYTLLAPLTQEHDTIDQILDILKESAPSRHHPFIPSQYSPQTPNIARIVGLASLCADIQSLTTHHQLMCKDIQDEFDRSQPPTGSHACFPILVADDSPPLQTNPQLQIQQKPQRPAKLPSVDMPFTPSPLPGSKHCRVSDDPGSAEIAHTTSRSKDSTSQTPPLNQLSLSSASPPSQTSHRASGDMDCDLPFEPQHDDPVSPSPSSEASSAPSITAPPPWPIDHIIRCSSVALDERPRPNSPTNSRNLIYLVHRPRLSNIWAPYDIVRTTEACDLFIMRNPIITGHTFTHAFPPASNAATDSNSSSVNLGDLVEASTPANESHFQFQISTRGNVSSDTTSVSGSYLSSGVGSNLSSSAARSLDSTGSFHPHLWNTAAHPLFRPPSCTNRVCGSMTYGCFHQNNHSCDFIRCRRQIEYAEFGWHCPHCDRDYCITCYPVPWEPASSIYSDDPSTQNPGTQELLHNDSPPSSPVASHSQARSEV
jgi:hypothetical protein